MHFIDGLIGTTPVGQVDSAPRCVLGQQLDAQDATLGGARYIYLKGVASTVAGSLVAWDAQAAAPTFQTSLAAATANGGEAFAVASGPILANQYGWYQIAGNAFVATNGTLTAGVVPYVSTTAGQITSTTAAGKAINNMKSLAATANGLALCQFDSPFGEAVVA